MTTAAAVRLARRIEPYDPLWFEEPVPPENAKEMAKVATATTMPIASASAWPRSTTLCASLKKAPWRSPSRT